MFSFLVRRLLSHTKNARSRTEPARRRQHARLRFENLEDRRMMAFTTPVSFSVGTNPSGIAVGDFNSDTRSDMAVVNAGPDGYVSVLMSNPDGSFATKVDYPSGNNSLDASAGDFNGDGKIDLAVIGTALDILLGNGDGTFGAPTEFPVGLAAHSVKVADFNHDGYLDVGTMNYNSASVSLGNGDGTFRAPLTTPVAGNNINLVVGDFNRDGNMDMATSNTNSIGTVNVLRGHGDGSFDAASSYYAFSAPVYLATGDFNEDGYLDFACPNSYAATSMSVLLNNGDGTYGAPHTYGIGQTGYEIEVADFNNDGFDDFAVRGATKYMVSNGKGDGTFYPSVEYATPTGRFEAGTHGDFNGDGAVDLAYPSASGVTVLSNDNADAQNLAGAVTFRVTAPATTTSKSVLPMTISAIDANGDVVPGFRGMVFISSSDPAASTASGYAFNPADAGIPYLFTAADAGSHTFTGAIRLVTAGNQTVKVSAPNMSAASVTVNVTGQVKQLQISAPATSVAGDTFSVSVSAIDTTGAIAPGYTTKVHFTSSDVLAGLPADYTFTAEDAGTHTFQVTLKTAGSVFVSATEVGGSINGGANVSVAPQAASTLALAGAAGAIGVVRPVTIVARDAYGNQATSYTGTIHFTSSDVAAVLPSDAALVNGTATVNVKFLTVGTQTLTATDVVNASITGTLSSNASAPIAASFAVSGYPASVAGNTNNFTVRVIDTIGQTASEYTGTVYFTSSDVQAGLPASYTFTTADAGIHNFSATFKTAGNQSINVRDLSGTLTGTQTGIAVAANSFSKFLLSVPNGTDSKGHVLVSAGETIQLKVSAIDIFGNSTSNYVGTIGLNSTDTAASIPASYSFSAADGGEHVFSVYLATATVNGQVWSFNVVDSANSASQATITNFEVVNSAAAIFKVTLPANIVAGQAFTSKITAVDAFGNTAKNYFGTVHFATSSANANLPADYTFNSSDLGVHDVTLSLNSAGTQSLTAVDASSSSVLGTESGSIAPSVATSLSVSISGSVVAGSAATVTVKATDAFGNVATGYRGTVSFASSDALAGLPANFVFNNKEAGVATFNVTLKTAGTQSITVRDSVNSTILGTVASNVTAASTAGSFVVSGFPSTTAGAAKTFNVQVKDIFGNWTSSYVGTVNFSSSDVQAGLPASYTFTSADAGSHTFTATLKTAGVQSISVKDSVTATAIGSQSGIPVTSSTATSIGISGFPATVAGVVHNVVVVAKDAYGNISTGFTGTVSLSSSDSKAGLPASYTFTASDAGTHTFAATLKTAGLQSISVKDSTGTLLATQSGISVTAAAAASFSISVPSSIVQGVGFKVTVTAIDAFGNVATGYLGKVTLSSNDPKGGKTSYSFSSKDAGVATLSYTFGTLGSQTLSIVDLANSLLSASIAVNVVSKK
jgi:FG-GAP-like repeat